MINMAYAILKYFVKSFCACNCNRTDQQHGSKWKGVEPHDQTTAVYLKLASKPAPD